ncbi:MAG: NAD(P)-dependent oxidoreductase [Spirochaetota bacterium]|nr:NAD(P)-dependent oxidoreductase [Spirochaetota bacterium]
MKLKVLVTGGSGFVGSHLIEKLLEKGFEVFCTLRKSSNIKWLNNLNINKYIVNWDDVSIIEKIVSEVDYIVHCAGVTKAITKNDYYSGNVTPTVNLLTAAKKNFNLKRFIFVSTQASSGPSFNSTPITEDDSCNPVSDYGKSKLEAEKEVLKYKDDFPVTILKPCSIYGPRDHEFYPLFKLIKQHLIVMIGDGTKKINMLYVSDFVEAICKTLTIKHPSGSVFFVTDGEIYDWKTIYHTAKEVYKKKVITLKLPLLVPKILGKFNDQLSRFTKKPYLLNSQKINEMIPDYWLCDSSKIRNTIGFNPNSKLIDGFNKTLNWYQKEKWL